MRVVYLSLQPRTGDGASDTHVDSVVTALRAAGVDVRLLAVSGGGSLARRLLRALAVQLRNLGTLRGADAVYIRLHPVAALTAWTVRRPRLLVEVNGVADDFLIAHPPLRRASKLLDRTLRYVLVRADNVLTVTPGLADYSRSLAPDAAVTVLPNAADPERFRPDLERPPDLPEGSYAIFFGALAPWQGIDLALRAALDARWPASVRFVVIGDGSERSEVQRAAAARPERITFLGSRDPETIPAYVANALVSLVPKRYHSPQAGQSPLKLYESAAAGVPIIATPLGGLSDVAALSAALEVVRPEPAALAQAVRDLSTDHVRATTMGAAARHAVLQGETWDHRAAVILRILHRSR